MSKETDDARSAADFLACTTRNDKGETREGMNRQPSLEIISVNRRRFDRSFLAARSELT